MAQVVKDGIARALITRAHMSYQTDRAMADALAALLVGKRIDRWGRQLHRRVRARTERCDTPRGRRRAESFEGHGPAFAVSLLWT